VSKIELINHTPLWVASKAIRRCWASDELSDTVNTDDNIGEKDRALIYRVGNQFAHKSTLRHVTYTFDCNEVSTKTLLALTRHSIGKDISVQSTRYTTSKRKEDLSFTSTADEFINGCLDSVMTMVIEAINRGCKNDDISMLLPQAYNYSFIMTMNIESLQHFLKLRTARGAHWDIQAFAWELYKQIPKAHLYLFEDSIRKDVS